MAREEKEQKREGGPVDGYGKIKPQKIIYIYYQRYKYENVKRYKMQSRN